MMVLKIMVVLFVLVVAFVLFALVYSAYDEMRGWRP
jgi:hypothetical protein